MHIKEQCSSIFGNSQLWEPSSFESQLWKDDTLEIMKIGILSIWQLKWPFLATVWISGRRHELYKRELCLVYGKTCNNCHKQNHFAAKCRSKRATRTVKAVEDDEAFQTHVDGSRVDGSRVDDSQCVTLRFENGNYLQFQADMGAQCNVVPLDLYKKATCDYKLK